MFSKTHSPERMNKPFISKIDDQSTQCDQSDPSNGMDRSCAATIYPVLDMPLNSGMLRAQGAQTTGDISARFSEFLCDWTQL
jgi:hypothetical protein